MGIRLTLQFVCPGGVSECMRYVQQRPELQSDKAMEYIFAHIISAQDKLSAWQAMHGLGLQPSRKILECMLARTEGLHLKELEEVFQQALDAGLAPRPDHYAQLGKMYASSKKQSFLEDYLRNAKIGVRLSNTPC